MKEFFHKREKLVKMRLGPKIVEKKDVVGGRAWQEKGQKYQHLKIVYIEEEIYLILFQ